MKTKIQRLAIYASVGVNFIISLHNRSQKPNVLEVHKLSNMSVIVMDLKSK